MDSGRTSARVFRRSSPERVYVPRSLLRFPTRFAKVFSSSKVSYMPSRCGFGTMWRGGSEVDTFVVAEQRRRCYRVKVDWPGMVETSRGPVGGCSRRHQPDRCLSQVRPTSPEQRADSSYHPTSRERTSHHYRRGCPVQPPYGVDPASRPGAAFHRGPARGSPLPRALYGSTTPGKNT